VTGPIRPWTRRAAGRRDLLPCQGYRLAHRLSTTTVKSDVYALIYGQRGLMAGLSIESSKISQINPDP
jgi:hypothetical protein